MILDFTFSSGGKTFNAGDIIALTGLGFALFLVNIDGSGLERVTHAESFASFPMFSRDGRRLVFTGNRNAGAPREQNVFIADWI